MCFTYKNIYKLKATDGRKNSFHANNKHKKIKVAILVSDNTDLTTNLR